MGVGELTTYERFDSKVERTKYELLQFLMNARLEGGRVVGYGAPGKGNSLRADLIEYLVDRNAYKQGSYTPGTRIPILSRNEF